MSKGYWEAGTAGGSTCTTMLEHTSLKYNKVMQTCFVCAYTSDNITAWLPNKELTMIQYTCTSITLESFHQLIQF